MHSVQWKSWHYAGLGIVLALVGLPLLLTGFGIIDSSWSDLSACPRRMRNCGLPGYPLSFTTLFGIGFAFSCFSLGLFVAAARQSNDVTQWIGVIGHFGIALAAFGYFFNPASPGSDFGWFAGFAAFYYVVYIGLFVFLPKNFGSQLAGRRSQAFQKRAK